ncbi:acyl carrier protein, partial [Streptomyces sp. NPDC004561]
AASGGSHRRPPEPPAAPAAPAAPGTAGDGLEAAIAAAWEQVLGHHDFTGSDWFFDVGGDSLLLIRVHTILERALPEWGVTIGDLYTCSAIDDLAAKLRAEAGRRLAS